MLKAFFSSATGMRAQELLIDNTANNLANVNTTGFRRSRIDFADLVYNTIRSPGSATSPTRSPRARTSASATRRSFVPT